MQTTSNTKIKWLDRVGAPFPVTQGIKQGAKLSPTLFKEFNKDILDTLIQHDIGASIGTTFVGAPTVADDIALCASDPVDLQIGLHLAHQFTGKDRNAINASKSQVVIFGAPTQPVPQEWSIGSNTVTESTSTTHLGIIREKKYKLNIEDRIQTGRRALYAMMGAGLHGRRGINPIISYQMYKTFALPKVIYGLETLQLTASDVKLLERFEVRFLKQIQSLPDRCANIAAYVLLGALPISLHVDMRKLTFFGSITRQKDTAEHEIARRQLAVKDASSHSWFIQIRQLLQKYDLPSAFDLMADPPTKQRWKSLVQRQINQHWKDHITLELPEKSSLRLLHVDENGALSPHQVCATIPSNTRAVLEASVKARILTGTYTLQSNRHKFNQHSVSPTCTLCRQSIEDRKHFILKCTSLLPTRSQYLPRLEKAIRASSSDISTINAVLSDDDKLLQCVIDSGSIIFSSLFRDPEVRAEIEKCSRILVYNLHRARKDIIEV